MKREETLSTLHAQYVCTFRPESGGGYTVRCAAFPELITNGRTLEKLGTMRARRLSCVLRSIKTKRGISRRPMPIPNRR
jgi:hypothetical protein